MLGVSRSGYYEWLSRPMSPRDQDNELLLKHIEHIEHIDAESRGTYGAPRVTAELALGLGWRVNHKRVARLMRAAGLQGLYRRRRRGAVAQPATEDDLVARQFAVEAPDRLWLTDITEHDTAEGKLYCAAVMDAFSRLVIGWSIADHIRTELVTDALGMAILRRQPAPDAKNGSTSATRAPSPPAATGCRRCRSRSPARVTSRCCGRPTPSPARSVRSRVVCRYASERHTPNPIATRDTARGRARRRGVPLTEAC